MNRELIGVDFRGLSHEGDCLDCFVAMPLAVNKMRTSTDALRIAESMLARTRDAFATITKSNENDLRLVASAAQDLLYRHVAQMTILDHHTRFYVDQVVRYFFMQLSSHEVRTFYILDNALRDDRLESTLELFDLAGISTTTPRRNGKDWNVLQKRLCVTLETIGHVAYIEPDNEVNHLDAVQLLAKQSVCVSTFRNLAPEDSQLEVLSFQDFPPK